MGMAWELMDESEASTDAARATALVPVCAAGVLVLTRDPVAPWASREIITFDDPVRFADLMAERDLDPAREPTVLMVNGEFYSRREWPELVLHPGDRAALMWLAAGGGQGSQKVLGIVMIIVGAVLTYFGYGQVGVRLMQGGALMLAGAMLAPKPMAPSPDINNALASPSPTYSLQAQGNYARLNQAIPCIYGRVKTYPDFGAQPWGEFINNEQYLYQLHIIGQGEYADLVIRIEDQTLVGTLGADGIWRSDSPFKDISWQIAGPGQAITYFPVRMLNSDAVAQQELLSNVSIGPFDITDAEIDHAGFDFVCGRGLYYANDSGSLDARSITFKIYATPLAQSGAAWVPGGAEVLLATETITEATTTPQRRSYRYPLTLGRWRFRCVRTDTKDTDSRSGHEINWVGLRGYVPGLQTYGNVTAIAMRILAGSQISSQSAHKVNVIATRMLPTWNPSTGWSLPVATRSIAWAYADVLRNDQYGAGVDDTSLPLAKLYDLETNLWKSHLADGECFDYAFDRAMPLTEALNHITRAGRCMWYQRGPDYEIVREAYRALPVWHFNMRNIVRGSFKVSFKFDDEDTTDAVEITYFDETTWAPSSFQCVPPGYTNDKPAQVTLPGVQRRAQAAQIGHYIARANRSRRVFGSFQTELEGRMVKPGDLIAVSHDVPSWGLSAELVAFTGTGKAGGDVLTLSEPTNLEGVWEAGDHYIALSTRTGGFSGPWRVIQGAEVHQVVLAEPITDAALALYTGGSAERTRVSFGLGDKFAARCLVLPPLRLRGDKVEISFVEDDPAVYDETGATAPAADQQFQMPITQKPTVRNLYVTLVGNTAAPMLDLSWDSSGHPSYYLVETSDDGLGYVRAAEPTSGSCRIPVRLGAVWVRVAAVAAVRGDWLGWSGNTAAMMTHPADVQNLRLAQPVAGQPTQFNSPDPEFVWDAAARADAYRIEVWQGGVKRGEYQRTDPRFTYTLVANKGDGGPRRAFEIRVFGLNSGGESANAAALSVSNPQLPACVIAAQQAGELLMVTASLPPTGSDWAGTRFVVSTNSGADPNALAAWSDGPGFMGQAKQASGTYYCWGAQYDSFGADGLNWSPRVTVVKTDAAQGIPILTAKPANPAAIGGQLAFFYDVAEATGERGMWGWDGAAWVNTRSGAYLVANSVTANKIQSATLSAISSALGYIVSAAIELAGSGWNYVRSNAKWLADGVNGWVFARNGTTGQTFFEAKAGNNLVQVDSATGGRIKLADAGGTERVNFDGPANIFALDGKFSAGAGYVDIGPHPSDSNWKRICTSSKWWDGTSGFVTARYSDGKAFTQITAGPASITLCSWDNNATAINFPALYANANGDATFGGVLSAGVVGFVESVSAQVLMGGNGGGSRTGQAVDLGSTPWVTTNGAKPVKITLSIHLWAWNPNSADLTYFVTYDVLRNGAVIGNFKFNPLRTDADVAAGGVKLTNVLVDAVGAGSYYYSLRWTGWGRCTDVQTASSLFVEFRKS
jgi:sulfur carrier protein ThiS